MGVLKTRAGLWLALLIGLPVYATVKPALLFTDNLVLQQGQPAPVWGSAAPGEAVTVSFAGQTRATVAGADGQWRVTLAPLAISREPRALVIAGTNTVTCRNVLVGEVWVASGQSNMAMALKSSRRGPVTDADAEIAAAADPQLRLFQAPIPGEEKSPAANNWQASSPDVVPLFSAVAYFFARELHAALQEPVGIVCAALGGSAIASWTPPGGTLFQQGLQPLCPYALRGMIWYQGESDPRLSYADEQRTLITRLRALWGQGDFPFFYVQIAPAYDFTPTSLPLLWQAQLRALAVPNSYMAATGDLGINLHPPDKHTVGRRLACLALALTYQKTKAEYSAPVYRSCRVDGDNIRLTFDHAAGLHCADAGPLSWFTIAGADGVFHPATAVIDGGGVRVSSSAVPHPQAVRYAWDKLAEPNLVNAAGLPTFAFRTDDWPVADAAPPPAHPRLTLTRNAPVADLQAAKPLLDAAPLQTIARGGRDYARVGWAVAGDLLLVRLCVRDARVSAAQPNWEGASAEVYLSAANSKCVRQLVYALQGPGREPRISGYEMGMPLKDSIGGHWQVTPQDGGYTLDALLPLVQFGIPANASSFLLDAAVTAAPYRGQKPAMVWLYSPQFAFSHNECFATVTLTEQR